MSWIFFFLTVAAILLALQLVKKRPIVSLSIAGTVPFLTFYQIGRNGYDEVFIVATISFFIAVNVVIFKKNFAK
ncbi:hypothetical protein [Bacillus sp. CGMCC 1.16541]|uniref:hypothetical protein n=1 Tax=Bacillus sp. CGMCC 1.16541 TaxID=2185143 RepID=UPI000D738040|nr:hypothetical protein [Bacillus sp. CGMCC 1.16541]